jgi:ribonucleoside-diphosphate reductase beta chain
VDQFLFTQVFFLAKLLKSSDRNSYFGVLIVVIEKNMEITNVQKRNGDIAGFDINKIIHAIHKAMEEVGAGTYEDAERVALIVHQQLSDRGDKIELYIPNIEEVQDLVEEALMVSGFHHVAKAYIIYRQERSRLRHPNIFERRVILKPYEYPQLARYVDSIRHSYWIHTEFNYVADVQDFRVNLDDKERNAIKNTMLAISQIEVAVKSFWGDIYKKMPKPEIGSVGATFAESEVRHHDAYSHLLEILGLNDEFRKLKRNPVIMKRIQYLDNSLQKSSSTNPEEYSEAIMLFSIFIEHVSLFSQFLIIMSFNKFKNRLKGISNAVEATSKEEQIHGDFGIEIIKIIKEENPTWFDKEHEDKVREICIQAYEAESGIVDWIFEEGELDFIPVAVVKEFIKDRFNRSLKNIGIAPVFDTDDALIQQSDWFDEEVIGTKHVDFFDKRSINYNKRSKSITSDDLF